MQIAHSTCFLKFEKNPIPERLKFVIRTFNIFQNKKENRFLQIIDGTDSKYFKTNSGFDEIWLLEHNVFDSNGNKKVILIPVPLLISLIDEKILELYEIK